MFLGTTQFGGTKVFGGTATESLPVAKGLSYATVTPQQGRTQGVGVKAPPPLSLIFYKNVITCTKSFNCFRVLFTC